MTATTPPASTAPVAPIALGPDEGEALWAFGALITIKASAQTTGGAVAVLEHRAGRGAGSPLHVHRREDEVKVAPRWEPAPSGRLPDSPRPPARASWAHGRGPGGAADEPGGAGRAGRVGRRRGLESGPERRGDLLGDRPRGVRGRGGGRAAGGRRLDRLLRRPLRVHGLLHRRALPPRPGAGRAPVGPSPPGPARSPGGRGADRDGRRVRDAALLREGAASSSPGATCASRGWARPRRWRRPS